MSPVGFYLRGWRFRIQRTFISLRSRWRRHVIDVQADGGWFGK